MKVKDLIQALLLCSPDADIELSVDFEKGGKLMAVEHAVIARREQIDPTDVGCVYLHNTKDDLIGEETLLDGNLFIT